MTTSKLTYITQRPYTTSTNHRPPLHRNFTTTLRDLYIINPHTPPFGVAFHPKQQHIIAAADENGTIEIINTDLKKTKRQRGDEDNQLIAAHENAIFDIQWDGKDGNKLATASGDQTCALWDAATLQNITTLRGHTGSCKTVRICKENPNMILSSSRDGQALLWDTRRPADEYKPIKSLHTAATRKRRRPSQTSTSPASVTCADFLTERDIITATATDGIVRFWDTRYLAHQPAKVSSNLGDKSHGITSLVFNSESVYVSSMSSRIFEVNRKDPSQHRSISSPDLLITSFYIRLALCSTLLACGSATRKIPLYDTATLQQSWCLEGHLSEVSALSFAADGKVLASCSDDTSIRIWRDVHDEPVTDYDESWSVTEPAQHINNMPTGRSTPCQKEFNNTPILSNHLISKEPIDSWKDVGCAYDCLPMKLTPKKTIDKHFAARSAVKQ